MNYSLSLPVDQIEPADEFCSGAAITEMAAAAEAAGFKAVHATEHPFPSRIGPDMGGHHALDPMVCMAFVAAATSRLRLHFNAWIPPYRNPFLSAKSLADLDVLSGGRVIGVAPGYLAGEFEALGVPLADRGLILDEALVAMKQAWTGEPVHMEGSGWAGKCNVMLPRPHQRPHPPIWIGGNSKAARRVVWRTTPRGGCPSPRSPTRPRRFALRRSRPPMICACASSCCTPKPGPSGAPSPSTSA